LPFDNPDAVIRFDDGQIRIADAVRVWARAPERTAREFVMAAQWLAVHEETRPVSFAAIERMLNEAADLIGQARTELAHAEATQNAERLARGGGEHEHRPKIIAEGMMAFAVGFVFGLFLGALIAHRRGQL